MSEGDIKRAKEMLDTPWFQNRMASTTKIS